MPTYVYLRGFCSLFETDVPVVPQERLDKLIGSVVERQDKVRNGVLAIR
jgi:hypothetical protein